MEMVGPIAAKAATGSGERAGTRELEISGSKRIRSFSVTSARKFRIRKWRGNPQWPSLMVDGWCEVDKGRGQQPRPRRC
jgi:hypothetical protein